MHMENDWIMATEPEQNRRRSGRPGDGERPVYPNVLMLKRYA